MRGPVIEGWPVSYWRFTLTNNTAPLCSNYVPSVWRFRQVSHRCRIVISRYILIQCLCDGEAGDGLPVEVAGGRVAQLDGCGDHVVGEPGCVTELRRNNYI
jgi:hypothetical protein